MIELARAIAALVAAIGFYSTPHTTVDAAVWWATTPTTETRAHAWNHLAACESNSQWDINTGNGYFGGLQFWPASWAAVGGTGYPHEASRFEQIYRAERLYTLQGPNSWPGCRRMYAPLAGLTRLEFVS